MTLTSARGSDCNKATIGGVTRLYGDKHKSPEKPHTIILFPGGSVEVARCSDGSYWVHVATDDDTPAAKITSARIDAQGRYCDEVNEALKSEIRKGGVNHIAFLIEKDADQ